MDIGIDLGTTFSVMAVNGNVTLSDDYPQGIYIEPCDVTVIPTPYAERTFPSVMAEDPDHAGCFVFGSDAIQRGDEGTAPAMFSKRKIGTKEEIALETRTVVARDVAREFLKYMKTCAEQALRRPVTRAVVTHPAYFDRAAVEETREAAKEAGFDMSLPEQMLMEPVAAALAYTRTDTRDPLRVMTYDMGGGTFDVTCIERREGVIDMRSFDGNHLLGGYNFDKELVHWIRTKLADRGRQVAFDENNAADRGRLARLLRFAESVKIALANARTDSEMVDVRDRNILVDQGGRPIQINERLSRAQFVELIRTYLDDATQCCKRALEKAKVTPEDLHEILLVGGSSYGPWVKESLQSAFPCASPRLFEPDLCVGIGAAIHASMVLPSLVEGGRYKLSLDVPETSPLQTISVSGILTLQDGLPVDRPLDASVRLPNGSVPDPAPVSSEGRFLLPHLELVEGEPSEFVLTLSDKEGTSVLEHAFQVTYAPEDTKTEGFATVLPKPLFIETVDGLVPIAQEGARLPARCHSSFERLNDNPNITLRLFQNGDPIGAIRIENIPPQGGQHSHVDLEVEVTEKNQIRGSAVVRAPGGKVVARTDVAVEFDVPEIGSAQDLQGQFNRLKYDFLAILTGVDRPGEKVADEGLDLIKNVEHVFEQQPLDRQEVHVALRRLNALLHPPEDEMKPPMRQFEAVVLRCREALRKTTEDADEVIRTPDADRAPDHDRRVEQARKSVEDIRVRGEWLTQLEKQAREAHSKADRLNWARLYDAVTDLHLLLGKSKRPIKRPPTPIAKMMATFEIFGLIQKITGKETELRRDPQKHQDWKAEIQALKSALQGAVEEVQKVDDQAPEDQCDAQIRIVFRNRVSPLNKRIDALMKGIVVGVS